MEAKGTITLIGNDTTYNLDGSFDEKKVEEGC